MNILYKRVAIYISLAMLFLIVYAFCIRNKPKEFKNKVVKSNIKLGVYYFDGWVNESQGYITPSLKNTFKNRKPVWGWVTSTPNVMEKQIALASNAGIGFFNFCWYFPQGAETTFKQHDLNHALNLYLNAKNKNKLQFSLLVTNHEGSEIGPEDWDTVSDFWIKMFKDNSYLKINGMPYLSFFSIKTLIKNFGSVEAINSAFNSLRLKAKKNNLKGVMIGVCTDADSTAIEVAKKCGFNFITGYNYASAGFTSNKEVPIENLNAGSVKIWNSFKKFDMPYIPVVTLNWDPRPWSKGNQALINSPRYTGYSEKSVSSMVTAVSNWIRVNPSNTTKEGIALVYAWNEYGEGAWLTPSQNDYSLLNGIKKGLNK